MALSFKNYQSPHTTQTQTGRMVDDGLHSWLVAPKEGTYNYPGWEDDYKLAREAADESNVSLPIPSVKFRNAIHRLNEKQRVFEGDRSHPRLVALDQLVLTYFCCEDDKKNAEKAHFDNFYDPDTDDVYFQSKLEGLENRQQLFYGMNHESRSQARGAAASSREITTMLGPCIICGERDKTHLFDPCGHLVCCQSCANTVTRRSDQSARSCPVCRVPPNKSIRVYFS